MISWKVLEMKSQLKAGAILSYLQMGLSIVIGIIYTPWMIRLLGQSEYGLYSTVASTISMLSVLSLGFNSGYIRYYSKYKSKNDYESIEKLNGLFLIIFLVIGVIALLCGLFLSFNLDLVFDKGLTDNEYKIARVLMLLLTANLSISFPMSVFSTIISSHEKFLVLKGLSIFKTVFSPMITLPLLLSGYRSITMVSVTVIIALVIDSVYLYYTFVKLKQKFVFRGFEKGLFFGVFSYTVFIALNVIVDQVNTNMGKVILGRYRGTTAVSIYAVAGTLYSYYVMFSTAVSGIFTPRIHKLRSEISDKSELKDKFTELFVKIGRIQFLILGLISTGLLFFGKEFITEIWAGNNYSESYYVLILLIFAAIVPLSQNVGIEIQRALNLHKFRSLVYICMAVVNLAFLIILSREYGAVGAAIGTALSYVLANGVVMNIYYYKKCNVNVFAYWKNILKICVGLILPIICGMTIRHLMDLKDIIQLCLGIVIYTAVYIASMWFISMNKYERYLIKRPLVKLFRR